MHKTQNVIIEHHSHKLILLFLSNSLENLSLFLVIEFIAFNP